MELNKQLVTLMDTLTKEFPAEDISLLKELILQNPGNELEVLMELLSYTYNEQPVGVRKFIEDPDYLGLKGQVYPVLLDDLEELFSGGYYEALMTGAIGWGKCLSGDSLVSTPSGLTRLKDVEVGDIVFGILWDGRITEAGVRGKAVSKKEAFRYTFNGTLRLECSADHPVLTQRGWLHIGELEESDFVASVRYETGGSPFNEHLVKWLAYMTAEGSTGQYGKSLSCGFTNGTPEILQEYSDCCYALGSTKIKVAVDAENYKTLSPDKLRNVLRGHGLAGKTAKEKRIPDYVWSAGHKALALFINRFFACDGSIYQKKPCKIECTLASEGLVDDLVLALRMLGVYSRKVALTKSSNGKGFKAWRVAVTSAVEIRKFLDVVGDIFTKPWTVELEESNGNKDIAPVGYSEMKDLRKLVGGIPKQVWNTIRVPEGQYLGRAYAQKILDLYGIELPDYWKLWLNPGICWERLESVEPLGEMELYDIEVPKTRNFIANGMVVHNSTFSEIAMCRMIYEASCFRNPQKVYGLMDGSVLAFINVSVHHENAKKVVFQGIKNKLSNSPYFTAKFPYNPFISSELRFPNNLWVFPVASGETGAIGQNVFGATMDEVNFMASIENSKVHGGRYDAAETLQKALIRRMKSRFMVRGKLPGILLQVSSARYPDDYLERRLKELKETADRTIFFRRYTQWDTLPKDKYSGDRFYISLGNDTERPEIMQTDEDVQSARDKGIEVMDIPVEYRKDFENDIDAAVRDFAGRPTLTISPFIMYRSKVMDAVQRGDAYGLEHAFTAKETTLQDGAAFDPLKFKLVRLRQECDELPEQTEEQKIIKKAKLKEYTTEKSKPRFVHIDLGITGDSAGLAMGHIEGFKEIERMNELGNPFKQRLPIIVIDFVLRVNPPKGGEIQIASVRNLVHELRSYGFWIKKVTYDQYQSRESRQQLIQSGVDAGYLSVDSNPEAYNAYKDALYDDRLLMYYYETLYTETIRLERNNKTGKIDHPANGSKDVSDAVAGVCFHCVEEAPKLPTPPPSLGYMDDGKSGRRDRTSNVIKYNRSDIPML